MRMLYMQRCTHYYSSSTPCIFTYVCTYIEVHSFTSTTRFVAVSLRCKQTNCLRAKMKYLPT